MLRFGKPDHARLGWLGERLAARHLRRRGWKQLASRLVTREAEVDLLFRVPGADDAPDWLVCVEVKTGRHGPRFRPGHRLDARRLLRLRAAARSLARGTGLRPRVDLVEVALARGPVRIHHHPGLQRPLARVVREAVRQ